MRGNIISNGVKKRHSAGRHERIIKNYEFMITHRKGTSYKDGVFVLTLLKNRLGHHRLGVSVGRSKLRLASKRNRIKRLVREVFRLNKLRLKKGPYDVVVSISKTPPSKIDFSAVDQRLQALFKKAGAV
jgi:ribonuclease P protein component